jgi:hypothetical protein
MDDYPSAERRRRLPLNVHSPEAEVAADPCLARALADLKLQRQRDSLPIVTPLFLQLASPRYRITILPRMGTKKEGVLRHLEGWELGFIAVTVALIGTFLAVPLRVAPQDLPLPIADERRIVEKQREDHELARGIIPLLEQKQLYDVRALGEAFRAYGRAEASSDMYEVVRTRKSLLDAVNRARTLGDDKLLGLRAYQKERFVGELASWERSGEASDEMAELGGPFPALAARYGWAPGGKLEMSGALRGIFFKRRWNEVTGLTAAPYDLSLDEHRLFYRFLLANPNVDARRDGPGEACRRADEWRLKKVGEIARIDPDYPALLARGVLLYRIGLYPAAAQALRGHLDAVGGGSHALRARNYLAEATARAAEESKAASP